MGLRKRMKVVIADAKLDALALYVCSRDPRINWFTRVILWAVAAYVLSPVDLIPDYIPYIGYLDDLIVIPLGIGLSRILVSKAILEENRRKAGLVKFKEGLVSITAQVILTILWLAVILVIVVKIRKNYLNNLDL